MKPNYRIKTKDGRYKFAGTGLNSWFQLYEAKQKVDYTKGEKIVEICMRTHDELWEVL